MFFFHFLAMSRTFLTAYLLSIFMSTKSNHCEPLTDLDGDSKVLLEFLEEKFETLLCIHFGLLEKFSDQIQNCPI